MDHFSLDVNEQPGEVVVFAFWPFFPLRLIVGLHAEMQNG